jgi:hypothetical protein
MRTITLTDKQAILIAAALATAEGVITSDHAKVIQSGLVFQAVNAEIPDTDTAELVRQLSDVLEPFNPAQEG